MKKLKKTDLPIEENLLIPSLPVPAVNLDKNIKLANGVELDSHLSLHNTKDNSLSPFSALEIKNVTCVIPKTNSIKNKVSEDQKNKFKLKKLENNKYITLRERFDKSKLQHILTHIDEFKKSIKKSIKKDGLEEGTLTIMKKYHNKSWNGKCITTYRQNNGIGRIYAIKSLSLQNLPRRIRHTISKDYYVDIDIVNAHPVFLNHICKTLNIECSNLDNYVNNRETLLLNVENGKQVILSIMNGGEKDFEKLKNKPKWIVDLRNEFYTIRCKLSNEIYNEDFLKHQEERIKLHKNFNHEASFMNVILCNFENEILMSIYRFFGSPKEAVFCFDGIMLPIEGNYDLSKCEKDILKKHNINIKLKTKEMNDGFELGEIEEYKEPYSLDYYIDFHNLINKTIYEEQIEEWLNNTIVKIESGGKGFFLTKNKKFDRLTKMYSVYYKPVKDVEILKNLAVKCNVKNILFDKKIKIKIEEAINDKKNEKYTPNEKIMLLNLKKEGIAREYNYTGISKSYSKCTPSYLENKLSTRNLPCFNDVDFIPFLKRKGDLKLHSCFNLFTGFPLENIKSQTNILFEKSLLYKHIRDEFCDGNADEFNHLLDHIADIVQCPADIRGSSHLIYSKQGIGKTLFGFFMAKILGSDHVISFENADEYFQKFNLHTANKLLKIFEEVAEKSSAFTKYNQLKGDQTKKVEKIEPKGLESFTTAHCARFWYFTNNENALYIEGDDRRHTLHRCNNRYANNLEYFGPIWEEVNDLNFCKSAFEFFAERKYDVKNVLVHFDTVYKNEQKEANLPNGILFIKELIENNYWNIPNDMGRIKGKNITNVFSQWCSRYGFKYNMKAFRTQIKKIGLELGKLRVSAGTISGYNINHKRMEKKFKELLKNDKFEFNIIENSDDEFEINN